MPSDEAMIISPEEIPRLAELWEPIYRLRPEPPESKPLMERVRNQIRIRNLRRLNRDYTPGVHVGRIDGTKVRRILIIRYDALGDYICTTGLITWLRAAIPHAEIDMVTSPRNDAVARIDPNLSNTFPIDYQFTPGSPRQFATLEPALAFEYDVAFCMTMSGMSKMAAVAAMLAPRAEKIALMHHERGHVYGELFTWQIERRAWREHWATAFTRLGVDTIAPAAPAPPMPVPPYIVLGEEAWRATEVFMRAQGLGFDGFSDRTRLGKGWNGPAPQPFEGARYVVVNISAFGIERQWSPAIASAVCRDLLARYPDRIVFVTGVPAEVAQIREVVSSVGSDRCRELMLSLPQFFCFVGSASLVISPDTATVHIAAAHGRPIVGLYCERVKIVEWHPLAPDFRLVLSPDEKTINRIPASAVIDAVAQLERVLGSHSPQPPVSAP
jgi:ADP-heptose:LPS heptosyltransferase